MTVLNSIVEPSPHFRVIFIPKFAHGGWIRFQSVRYDLLGFAVPLQRLLGGTVNGMAARIGGSAAQLSIALALSHPRLATALLGVTKPEHLKEDIDPIALVPRLEEIREELDAIAIARVGHPKLYNTHNNI